MVEGVAGLTEPFEALAECIDAIVFVTDESMRMLYASPMLELQTGFTAADFQFQQGDNPFIHREDADDVAQALSSFLASPVRVSDPISNRFLDRWGRTHRQRSVVTKIEFRGVPALLFVCRGAETSATTDVDDRQYRAFVESADDAIVRLDNAGRFLFANHKTHELLGYDSVELGQMRFDDLVEARDHATFATELGNAVGAVRPVRFELHLVAKGAQVVHVQAVVTSLGRFGQPGELLAILRVLAGD